MTQITLHNQTNFWNNKFITIMLKIIIAKLLQPFGERLRGKLGVGVLGPVVFTFWQLSQTCFQSFSSFHLSFRSIIALLQNYLLQKPTFSAWCVLVIFTFPPLLPIYYRSPSLFPFTGSHCNDPKLHRPADRSRPLRGQPNKSENPKIGPWGLCTLKSLSLSMASSQ